MMPVCVCSTCARRGDLWTWPIRASSRWLRVLLCVGRHQTSPALSECPVARAAQIENQQPVVFQHTTEFRTQPARQCAVIVEPPVGRPGNHNILRAGPAKSLELVHSFTIVGRRPMVATIALDEGDDLISRQQCGPQLV